MTLTAVALIETLMQPIERTIWDSFWLPVVPDVIQRRQVAFIHWGLEETFIIIPDEPPIPAVGVVVLPFWTGLVGWLSEPEGGCPDGCPRSRYWD